MFLFYQAITTCLPKITKTFHHRDSMRTTNAAVHLRRHTSPPPFTLILSSRDSISSLNFSIWNFFFIVAIVEKKMGAPKKSAARVSEDHDELVRVPLQAIMLADSFTTKLDLSLLNAPKLSYNKIAADCAGALFYAMMKYAVDMPHSSADFALHV
ncbi:uncharacterized protein [Medicago truncatula]|uniref:uncharacterized protein n=1 Tax=Medicago truncatula TaxID=3880 RepID=UPI000D2F3269|nr:uncharacterized protein LOC11422090 [Medicago truncatula]